MDEEMRRREPEGREEEINPLRNVYLEKKNRSVITDITDITDRKSLSFYISSRIAKAFKTYSRLTGKALYWCAEEAFLEYMRNHPIPQVSLTVAMDFRSFLPDLGTRLKSKILKEQLTRLLDIISRVSQDKDVSEDVKFKLRKQLQGLVLQAVKVHPPDEELMAVLKDVEELL